MLVERARLGPARRCWCRARRAASARRRSSSASWLGARVIAATRGPEKGERARALGADEVIDAARGAHPPARPPAHRRARAPTSYSSTSGLRPGTRASAAPRTAGASSPAAAPPDGSPPPTCPSCSAKRLADPRRDARLARCARAGARARRGGAKLRPVIDRVLPLAECRRGHELLEAGAVFGEAACCAMLARQRAGRRAARDADAAARLAHDVAVVAVRAVAERESRSPGSAQASWPPAPLWPKASSEFVWPKPRNVRSASPAITMPSPRCTRFPNTGSTSSPVRTRRASRERRGAPQLRARERAAAVEQRLVEEREIGGGHGAAPARDAGEPHLGAVEALDRLLGHLGDGRRREAEPPEVLVRERLAHVHAVGEPRVLRAAAGPSRGRGGRAARRSGAARSRRTSRRTAAR